MIRRLPWEPLEATISAYFHGVPSHTTNCICIPAPGREHLSGACWKTRQVAEVLDMDVKTVIAWRRVGSVPVWQADYVAVKFQTMPYMIWPEWEDWANEQCEKVLKEPIFA